MTSERFQNLAAEIPELAAIFLDFPFNPGGDYTKTQLTKAAAYTVLTHSEIEAYFEDQTLSMIDAAKQLWKTERRSCTTIVTLCSFLEETRNPPQEKPDKDIWQKSIYDAIAKARNYIKNNHGIRPHHLVPMLSLVSFDVRQLDDNLLSELDTLGTIRGGHAHTARAVHLGQTFDPFDRKQKIEQAITLIEQFDVQFEQFRQEQFGLAGIAVPLPKKSWFQRISRKFGLEG